MTGAPPAPSSSSMSLRSPFFAGGLGRRLPAQQERQVPQQEVWPERGPFFFLG